MENQDPRPATAEPQDPRPGGPQAQGQRPANAPTLEESEERFRLLVESVKDYAIFMLDPQGRVMSWNAGAQRIKGYAASEIIGKHFSTFYTPEAIESDWPNRELEIAASEGRLEDEGWRIRKDGTRFWANVVITALRDRTGELRGFAKVTRDMTERRNTEERVRRLNTELERQVAEIARTNRELELKNQENEAFVYSVSHDLRQPLVNLQGFSRELGLTSEELRRALQNSTAPELAAGVAPHFESLDESVHYIESSVLHLSRIIDGLLRLSRAGRVDYARERVDVAQVVRRLIQALHGTISARKVQMKVGPLPKVDADPSGMEQVFANLMGNALNYLDPRRPGRIEIGSEADPDRAGMIRFHVKDNGSGIPAGGQTRIFQAFQRLHPELAPGEGIGLAIVQRIVERHGGRIWFDSEVGQGTTFYLTLPGADA